MLCYAMFRPRGPLSCKVATYHRTKNIMNMASVRFLWRLRLLDARVGHVCNDVLCAAPQSQVIVSEDRAANPENRGLL